MRDYTAAHNEVKETAASLLPIAESVVGKHSQRIDEIMKRLRNERIETISDAEIRNLMTELQVEEYYLSKSKDSALLRQDCAIALEKTTQAEIYNSTEGTQNYRSNKAIADTIERDVVRILYSTICNMMKTKAEETHRMIGVLNSVLISRGSEFKYQRQNTPMISSNPTVGIDQVE